MDHRQEALEKLKDNDVSIANMEVWIAGYIAGRENTEILKGYPVSDKVKVWVEKASREL